jgi:hypothetical protein
VKRSKTGAINAKNAKIAKHLSCLIASGYSRRLNGLTIRNMAYSQGLCKSKDWKKGGVQKRVFVQIFKKIASKSKILDSSR